MDWDNRWFSCYSCKACIRTPRAFLKHKKVCPRSLDVKLKRTADYRRVKQAGKRSHCRRRKVAPSELICKYCSKISSQFSKHEQHERTHTGERPFKCDTCEASFNSKRGLGNHKFTFIHTAEKRYKCHLCDYGSLRKSYLNYHILSHFNENARKCEFCKFVAFSNSRMKMHLLEIHTSERPFKCDHCGAGFRRKQQLQSHMLSHQDDKPFKCESCDYKTIYKRALKIHVLSHAAEKPFNCDFCKYSTVTRCRLKTHMRIHTGDHTGEKPYKCDRCDYSCRERRLLVGHIRIRHTGERPFECKPCNFAAATMHTMRSHKLSRRHKEACALD